MIFASGTKRKKSVTKILYVAIWTIIRECISSFLILYMRYVTITIRITNV